MLNKKTAVYTIFYLSIVLLIAGITFVIIGIYNQKRIAEYNSDGIIESARIASKYSKREYNPHYNLTSPAWDTNYLADITFSQHFEDGSFDVVLTTIGIGDKAYWDDLVENGYADIYYLARDPQKTAILKVDMDVQKTNWMLRPTLGLIILAAGITAFGASFILAGWRLPTQNSNNPYPEEFK